MTFAAKRPPLVEGGPLEELSSFGGVDLQANIPNQAPAQEENRASEITGARGHLRLVPRQLRPRRHEVRIVVSSACMPYGRSRAFRLAHDELDELIAVATRMERRP
jgi:hypothetical protein